MFSRRRLARRRREGLGGRGSARQLTPVRTPPTSVDNNLGAELFVVVSRHALPTVVTGTDINWPASAENEGYSTVTLTLPAVRKTR